MEDLNMSTAMFMRANGKMTRCAAWGLCYSRLPSRQLLALGPSEHIKPNVKQDVLNIGAIVERQRQMHFPKT